MVPTKNVSPTGGTEEPQDTKKTDDLGRPVAETSRDDSKGQKFKEVLSTLDEKAKSNKVVVQTETTDAPVSPMSLIVDTVSKKPKATTEEPVVAVAETTDENVEVVAETPQIPRQARPNVKTDVPVATTVAVNVASEDTPEVTPTVTPTITPTILPEKTDTVTPVVVLSTTPTTTPTVTAPVPTVVPQEMPKTVVVKAPDEKAKVTAIAPDAKMKKAVDTDSRVSEKPEEDTDTVQVNLAVQPTPLTNAPVATALNHVPEQAAKAREVLIKLAQEMIAKLDVITTPDKTDTSIKLQYPPLFAGAELVITEHKTAQHQFNVTFTGLSPEAHNLIAMKANQEDLRTALLEKGYTLQMITIEQKIPGLESTKTESAFAQLGKDEDTAAQGDATEEEK